MVALQALRRGAYPMDDSVHGHSQHRRRSRRLRLATRTTRDAVLTGTRWLGRQEAAVLVAALSIILALFGFAKISEELGEGELAHLDEWLLHLLRVPGQPQRRIGPSWLLEAAQDITPLGGRTMLVLVTLFAIGYLALERKYGAMWLVGVATAGGGLLSTTMKQFFGREPRWTPESRPVVDGANPASEGAAPSTSVVPRWIGIEQELGAENAVEGSSAIWPRRPAGLLRAKRDASCSSRGGALGVEARAPAFRPTGEDVGVVEQAVEHRGDGGGIAEEFAPVLHGPVRSEQGRGLLVAAHHDLEEILGGGVRELAHPEIVDDEQGDGGDGGDEVLPGAGELRLREILDEDVGLAIEDTVALLDHGEAQGLRQVALAGAGRAEEEGIVVLRHPARGRQLEDEGPVQLLVEVEVKGVQALAHVPEARLLEAAFEEAVLAADELVLDEPREEVEGDELLGLRLVEPGLEGAGHAGAAELAEGTAEFDEVHVGISS